MTQYVKQARLSGLGFVDNNDNKLKWKVGSSVLDDEREGHASVVLGCPTKPDNTQTVVVLGGFLTNSVIVWDASTKQWQNGPNLVEKRGDAVAVVCGGRIYVIGGYNGHENVGTMESISITAFQNFLASSRTSSNDHQWEESNIRTSVIRTGCAVVAVHDRYIVIMGGTDDAGRTLSSIEIVDTLENKLVTDLDISMTTARSSFGATVIGNCIVAVGGENDTERYMSSIEYFEFNDDNDDENNENNNAYKVFGKSSSASWKLYNDIALSNGNTGHAVTTVRSCAIVAGGLHQSVEVIDFQRQVVWKLPNLTVERNWCSMVALSNRILVIGGDRLYSVESLPVFGSRPNKIHALLVSFIEKTIFLRRT